MFKVKKKNTCVRFPFLIKLQASLKRHSDLCFSCEFCENFKNTLLRSIYKLLLVKGDFDMMGH